MAASLRIDVLSKQRKFLMFLLCAAVFLLVSACVFPTRLADDDPYSEKVIGFVEPGDTLRADIESVLGTPHRTYSAGRWWLYSANRQMTEWLVFIATPGGASGATLGGDVRLYSLIIEFGEQDVVKNHTIVTDKSTCTSDQSLCYEGGALTAIQGGAAMAEVFHDESTNALVSDEEILARLTGIETWRFSATSDSGSQLMLTERSGLVFEIDETVPFTGHIVVYDTQGAKRLERTYDRGKLNGVDMMWYENGQIAYRMHYRDNLLHGPVSVWEPDGSEATFLQGCYENGEPVYSNKDKCQP